MYISSKVAAQTATTILSLIVTMLVTHFGFSLNATDQAIVSGVVTVAASAFAGWYVKEADPDELKRSAIKAKLVRDYKAAPKGPAVLLDETELIVTLPSPGSESEIELGRRVARAVAAYRKSTGTQHRTTF